MKKYITLILITIANTLFSQSNNEVKIADLKTPNSPGFQILDIAPSSIERPTNPKEFSLKVISLLGNGSSLPKNFAFEVSPYWFFNFKDQNVYKYLDINENKQPKDSTRWAIKSGLLRKFSLSIASVYSDSTSGSLLKNTNYIAIGARTNLLTIRTKRQNSEFTTAILNAATIQSNAAHINPDGSRASLSDIETSLDKDKSYSQEIAVLKKLPLLQLDAAYAYSNAFQANQYSDRRFNRSGIWATLAINAQFKNPDHYLSFLGLLKFSNDNVLIDTPHNIFNSKKYMDYGAKVDYNLNKFSLSIEYLKRNYSNLANINTERTVGILQYKINNNLYVVGTFGKNFGNYKNLFTLLGVNWGFGGSPLSLNNN